MEDILKETLFVLNKLLEFSYGVLVSAFPDGGAKAFEGHALWSVPLEGISNLAILTAVNELNLWFHGVKFIAEEGSALIVCGEKLDFDHNAAYLLPAALRKGETELQPTSDM